MEVRQALGKFREVFLAGKNAKSAAQLGIEEELVQLSRDFVWRSTKYWRKFLVVSF